MSTENFISENITVIIPVFNEEKIYNKSALIPLLKQVSKK